MLAGVARQGKLIGSLSKVVLTAATTQTIVLVLKSAQQGDRRAAAQAWESAAGGPNILRTLAASDSAEKGFWM